MQIKRFVVHNWRNFQSIELSLGDRLFIVGSNAAGKSNLLDAFRFLRDVAMRGGGLSTALDKRGGFSKVRSLFARNHNHGHVIFNVTLSDGDDEWEYHLAISSQQRGNHLPEIVQEKVCLNGKEILSRPNQDDKDDPQRLTQTHLEQISTNASFRKIADFFSSVRYFHPVPQVIRDPAQWTAAAEGDPYGRNFIAQINDTQERTRKSRLDRIEKALQKAIPEFEALNIEVDSAGRPHLVTQFRYWRKNPVRHREAEMSDGTLRLIGLLWSVVSAPKQGILLLEEPELSLNSAIVKALPTVLASAQRQSDLQIIVSTHAPELLDEQGVNEAEVLLLRPSENGSKATLLVDIDEAAAQIDAEVPFSSVVDYLLDGVISGPLADIMRA